MARFACERCGKCCRSFGGFITIVRQLNLRDYYCRYGITNEIFPVKVESGFEEYIADLSDESKQQEPVLPAPQCCFLVKDPSSKCFTCAVYSTRPGVCRNFRCYRMLIFHAESGGFRGKVIGSYQLRTEDEALRALWDEKIVQLPHRNEDRFSCNAYEKGSDPGWLGAVMAILSGNGYRGEPVED